MANLFEKHHDKLTGVWSLITCEMYDGEGPDKKLLWKPHGDEPLGKVVISKSGYLLATLVPPAVMTPLASDEWTEASDEDVLRIGRRLTTYGGPMVLHEREDGGFIWYTTVEVAHNPNMIGKQQIRRADFEEQDGTAYMTLRPVKEYILRVRGL